MLDLLCWNHEPVLEMAQRASALVGAPGFEPVTSPGLEVPIDPEREDDRGAGYAMEFPEQSQSVLRFPDVMQESHAEDAIS